MKRHKAHDMDGMKVEEGRGHIVLTDLTNIFYNTLKTKQIPDSWHKAKTVILFIKGDLKDIKNYRPISLLPHDYKMLTRLLQTRTETSQGSKQYSEKAFLHQSICKI